MVIYTAHAGGEKLEKVKELGLGILASIGRGMKGYKDVYRVALDNGAFSFWSRGFPFLSSVFRKHIIDAHKAGIKVEWIVAPDMVGKGQESLELSMAWATSELKGARLALAVQDGITLQDINSYVLNHFTTIFVGGTADWKWKTAKDWVNFSHNNGKHCHIGRCGTLKYLEDAYKMGADSVDSSSFARNDSWHIIEEFMKDKTKPNKVPPPRSYADRLIPKPRIVPLPRGKK
ncbi:hypothetical protein CMI37_00515 [Candidatus Pacearchaeota archaeon]|nr:hypothetical protein [Candidatus Pacearchaeota archaeon]